jgi:hypothetical protein
LDTENELEWEMELTAVFEAYMKLEDFKTIYFKKFVPLHIRLHVVSYYI